MKPADTIKNQLARLPVPFIRMYTALSYAILASIFMVGVMYSFLTPAVRAPDEPVHWDTAVRRFAGGPVNEVFCSNEASFFRHLKMENLISGHLISPGKYRDIDSMKERCGIPLVGYGNYFTYPGYVLTKSLMNTVMPFKDKMSPGGSVAISYLTARFLQGILVILMLARLIWLTRLTFRSSVGNLTILTLGLSPLFLQQSFAISGDTVILAAAIAAVNVACSIPRLRYLDLAIATFLIYTAIMAKPTYAPAFGLWAAMVWILTSTYHIPTPGGMIKTALRRLPPWRSREGAFLCFHVLIMASVGYHFLTAYMPPIGYPSPAVIPSKQLEYIKANFGEAFLTIHNGIMSFHAPKDWWVSLGWFDFSPGAFTKNYWQKFYTIGSNIDIVIIFVLLCLGLIPLLKSRKLNSANLGSSATALTFGAIGIYLSAFACSLSMFIIWTPVGQAWVDGLQVRYFFPLFIMGVGLFKVLAGRLHMQPQESVVGPPFQKPSFAQIKQATLNAGLTIILLIVGVNVVFYMSALALDTLVRYY